MAPSPLETVVGLEVHLQLATRRKLFCPCENRFDAPPNTRVCPVCLGLPGALPRLRDEAVAQAVRLALALGCEVEEMSSWARKSYFYPDLAKGYQITQWDQPLARGGRLAAGDHGVALTRLHLEEDAGRLHHLDGATGVDFNRGGVPLVELVTEPEVAGAEAAEELLRGLRALVRALGVSEGRMEEGHLRCDANVSVRRSGEPLGPKVEVKNLNSFRAVGAAVAAEARRQGECRARGEAVRAETRGFDGEATFALRDKEESADYRYLPEPDLPPLRLRDVLGVGGLKALAADLPELPEARRGRYVGLGLDDDTASRLAEDAELGDWFEAAWAASGLGAAGARTVAAWVGGEVTAELHARGEDLASAPPAEHLGALVAEMAADRLSRRAAKRVLAEVWESGETPLSAIERLGLVQVSDRGRISLWVEEELAHVERHDPELLTRYRNGEDRLLGHFVGRVMRRSAGRADPRRVGRLVEEALAADPGRAEGLETVDPPGESGPGGSQP